MAFLKMHYIEKSFLSIPLREDKLEVRVQGRSGLSFKETQFFSRFKSVVKKRTEITKLAHLMRYIA